MRGMTGMGPERTGSFGLRTSRAYIGDVGAHRRDVTQPGHSYGMLKWQVMECDADICPMPAFRRSCLKGAVLFRILRDSG